MEIKMNLKDSIPEGIYRDRFPVRFSDCAFTGQLKPSALLDYFQEVSGNHTDSVGFGYREQLSKGIFWVLSRMSIQIDAWPQWSDEVIVDTWARSTKAIMALRDYRFGTEKWGFTGKASSAWVILKDQKPQRPEEYTKIYKLSSPEAPLIEVPESLSQKQNTSPLDKAQTMISYSRIIQARWEDLDMNGHVNNKHSVDWCLQAHKKEFLTKHLIQRIDVNYLAQMFENREYRLIWDQEKEDAGGIWNYGIFDAQTAQVVMRIRLNWIDRK